jgi:hypothetical protein
MKARRDISHNEIAIDMLKADPDFTNEYLATALEETDLPGGQFALLPPRGRAASATAITYPIWKSGNRRERPTIPPGQT